MMKKLKKLSGCVLLMCGLAACSLNKADGGTYYKFAGNDYNYIINYKYTPDQVIVYENQFGEQLHFKVISNTLEKRGQYSSDFESFTGGGSSLDYYYDNKTIQLEIVENQSRYLYNLVIYNFSKSLNIFKNGIQFPLWNVQSSTFYDEIDRPFNIDLMPFNRIAKTQMTVNGHLFLKVVTINSDSVALTNSGYGGSLQSHVNKVYYDFDFGIIAFDDLDGKKWKVIYP